MKKLVIAFLIVLVIAAAVMFFINCKTPAFNGSRVKNPDCYTMEFTRMNGSDEHSLELTAVSTISVDFSIEKGHADLVIGIPGEKPVYTGNDIISGVFELEITEPGRYTAAVTARNAAGFINIYTH